MEMKDAPKDTYCCHMYLHLVTVKTFLRLESTSTFLFLYFLYVLLFYYEPIRYTSTVKSFLFRLLKGESWEVL